VPKRVFIRYDCISGRTTWTKRLSKTIQRRSGSFLNTFVPFRKSIEPSSPSAAADKSPSSPHHKRRASAAPAVCLQISSKDALPMALPYQKHRNPEVAPAATVIATATTTTSVTSATTTTTTATTTTTTATANSATISITATIPATATATTGNASGLTTGVSSGELLHSYAFLHA
ncbi:unnamed protein product, partial [Gongylonema pulchrum]|uniref:Secreted mucin n=1 Tax=Gongylonema pulchrum TaxID=637853 RepID=A0A183D2G0_9BILA